MNPLPPATLLGEERPSATLGQSPSGDAASSAVMPLSEETCPCRPLSRTEVWASLRNHPPAWMYLVTSAVALLMVTVYFLDSSGELSLLFPLLALIGWLRLWGGAAAAVLLLGCWLSYFPFGLPIPGIMPLRWRGERVLDPLPEVDTFLAVLALVVYVSCHWRYVSLLGEVLGQTQALEGEELHWRRPVELVPANEWLRCVGQAALAVALAWMLGMIAQITMLMPGHDPPLSWNEEDTLGRAEALPRWLSRGIILTTLAAVVVVTLRAVLWLLRHRRFSREEAAMILQEQAWEQLHREWRRVATFHHRYQTRQKR